MKKSTFLKIAMAFSLVLLVSGAFAQINLTIRNEDGSLSANAVVYTIPSSGGATVTVSTATALGVATWTPVPVGTYNYLVRNAGSSQWNAYSINYTVGPVNTSITLSTKFNPTPALATDYVANRLNNKVTKGRSMPFWVYPSFVQNPAWTVPGATKATEATITTNLVSTFAWSYLPNVLWTDASTGANDNYVELSFNPVLATPATTSVYELSVVETPSGAYGGCVGQAVKQYATVINPPYIKISTATTTGNFQVVGGTQNVIVSGCAGAIGTTNVQLTMDNTNEEFPYFIRLDYKVYNATIAAGTPAPVTLVTDVTAATMVAYPALEVQGGITATHVNNTANPYRVNASPQNLFGAVQTFQIMNNAITVYQFKFESWNAKISRKSDYLTFRNSGLANENLIYDAVNPTYTWYSTVGTVGDVTEAYVIVFPQPVTGPIYHIPNTWGQ